MGIMAGPSLSAMTGSYIESSDGIEWGVNFRGNLDTRLFGSVWLSTGVSYIQKGGSKLTLSDEPETWGFVTNYIQFPVALRPEFRLGDGPWSIGPFTGLTLGLNTGCKVKPGDELEFNATCADTLPGGTAEKIELAVPIGVDVWIEFPGASRFVLEARYEIGLTNVLSAAAEAGQTARQRVFVAMFGFYLPLFVSP